MHSRARTSVFARSRFSWAFMAFFTLLSFGLGIFAIRVDPKSGIVPKEALLEASGKVAWMKANKYGIHFGLVGVRDRFDYQNKAGDTRAVEASLQGANNVTVKIRYEPKTHGPVYSDVTYHTVWEIAVGDREIRTYKETSASWESDNRIAPWLGLAAIGGGFFLGYASWHAYRSRCRSRRYL